MAFLELLKSFLFQETHSSLRQFNNELEAMAEIKRQIDTTHTADRQADMQASESKHPLKSS